jgi:putative flippase GtrA
MGLNTGLGSGWLHSPEYQTALSSYRGERVTVAESAVETEVKRLSLFNQLFRFVLIGGGCALIDSGTYALLLTLGWPYWLSKSISFILGTTASYLINRRFTFTGASKGNTTAKAGGFALVYLVTFFVNVGTNQLMISLTPNVVVTHTVKIAICWVVAQGVATLMNFVMLKWVIFRD